MNEITKVALDAMGGDNAPKEMVKGALEAINSNEELKVYLVGQEARIKAELEGISFDKSRLEIVHATEVIETAEPPANAIRNKKDSSIVVGLKLVKDGTCDAFVSAGSTGAVLVGAIGIVRTIKGIKRPALAPFLPTEKGVSLLIDCGANVDARPGELLQFAKMGSIYYENTIGKEKPTVGIVNIGAEEDKGNALVKETFPLLKACDTINFIGSCEARDIPSGYCDVMVTEAFVGNVVLKMFEGVGKTLISELKKGIMSSIRSKLAGVLLKPALKKTLAKYDANAYGGAPMLGLNGLVVKTHGSSKALEVKNTLEQCITFNKAKINQKIAESTNL
ncbi:MAG: phosphate acyltransferase PlsX [Lachnospiraceae bacterium]|nr:phosphate acyltransferase PlsX [Lachnospiraceae bacterium]